MTNYSLIRESSSSIVINETVIFLKGMSLNLQYPHAEWKATPKLVMLFRTPENMTSYKIRSFFPLAENLTTYDVYNYSPDSWVYGNKQSHAKLLG